MSEIEREAARKKSARFKKLFADPVWRDEWYRRFEEGQKLVYSTRRYPRPLDAARRRRDILDE